MCRTLRGLSRRCRAKAFQRVRREVDSELREFSRVQCVVALTCVPSVFAESVVRLWVERVHCITMLVRLRPGLVLAVCLCIRQLCDSDLSVFERQKRCTLCTLLPRCMLRCGRSTRPHVRPQGCSRDPLSMVWLPMPWECPRAVFSQCARASAAGWVLFPYTRPMGTNGYVPQDMAVSLTCAERLRHALVWNE